MWGERTVRDKERRKISKEKVKSEQIDRVLQYIPLPSRDSCCKCVQCCSVRTCTDDDGGNKSTA